MAENERFGREPIEIAEIGQDFCNLTYGVSPCRAGRSNYINNSSNFGDATNWDQDTNVDPTYGQSDPDGGTDAVLIDIVNNGFAPELFSTENVPQGTTGDVWYTLQAKQTVGGNIDRINFQIKGDSDIGGTIISVSCYFGTAQPIRWNGADVTDSVFTELDDDWVRWDFAIPRSKIIDPGYYRLIFLDDPSLAAVGDSVLIYAPQITTQSLQSYLPTVGEPIVAIDTRPCFNTRATCQDPENYDKGTLTLKFVNKQSIIPRDGYYIPSLTGATVTPAKLNPGGANKNASALGERANVTLTFQDHPHSDRVVDPYRTQRNYEPMEQGTFWSKWRARNPYYMHRPITLRTGYLVDGAVTDEVTRAFVITGFSGPDSNGKVIIKGKDILTLIEDSKAQAPSVSTGKLSADVTDVATSLTLTPAGVGDDEYPASGYVRVNKEVMSFTRSGDTLTITRGEFGTVADGHEEDDTVQLCLRYSSEAPQDILEDLLVNYANVPSAFLDTAGWATEALDYLPRLYTAIITEPESVGKLVGEMCQQMYFTVWFDERESLVKLRAVRLAENDTVYELNDNSHLIEDSVSWRDLTEELITQVWVYYGQTNPTEKLDQADNYAAVSVTADPDAESADRHNLRRIKKVFSRWIDAGNASAADDLGARILNRYGNAPREATFRVDAKDNYLWLGDFIRLTNRLRVDRFGNELPANLQIFQASESALGSEFSFTAQEFIPAIGDEIDDPNIRNIPIGSDFLNVNLRELHDSLFGAPAGTETVTFIVRSGVTIGGYAADTNTNVPYAQRDTSNDFYNAGNALSTGEPVGTIPILQRQGLGSVTTYNHGDSYPSYGTAEWPITEYPASVAIDTGTWPAGVTLKLVVEPGARVLGEGGNGCMHMVSGSSFGVPGGDGGHTLSVQYDIEINNAGIIAGGGGGGVGVWLPAAKGTQVDKTMYVVSGGGGAGLEISDVSTNVKSPGGGTQEIDAERQATNGAEETEGSGGFLNVTNGFQPIFGNTHTQRAILSATSGGTLAQDGQSNASILITEWTVAQAESEATTTQDDSGGVGGSAGDAITAGANLVTWVNKGDVRGSEVT